MFFEWAAAGAAIGIKIFFCIAAFALCCLAVLAIVGLMALIAKWAGDDGQV